MQLTYRTDEWWGNGHYIVYAGPNADRCQGRVSRGDDGLWYAYPEPLYPGPGRDLKPSVADAKASRDAAGRALYQHHQDTPREPTPVRRGDMIVGHIGDGRFT
jgi:hypothetical protein